MDGMLLSAFSALLVVLAHDGQAYPHTLSVIVCQSAPCFEGSMAIKWEERYVYAINFCHLLSLL